MYADISSGTYPGIVLFLRLQALEMSMPHLFYGDIPMRCFVTNPESFTRD